MASLFQACKTVVRNQASDTLNIGGYDIGLELYHQSDIDNDAQYGNVSWGDNDESKIVVVAGDTITIPSGYTLTPDSPKKSLVLFCNNLVNNGTISMYQKAPNVLPHDYYILESSIAGTARNIVIPAYANNSLTDNFTYGDTTARVGNSGTNRQCGSGGLGISGYWTGNKTSAAYGAKSGSGYAFGGGAGSGAAIGGTNGEFASDCSVDTTYPMRGGNGNRTNYDNNWSVMGGVGNPVGTTTSPKRYTNNFGCGGRIAIFCNSFTNNGIITVNGTDAYQSIPSQALIGGPSGAGAIDIFYTNKIKEGTITANGGNSWPTSPNIGNYASDKLNYYTSKGGNGSITLTQWTQNKIVKETIKYFSRSNVNYLLTQMAERIKDSRMGE